MRYGESICKMSLKFKLWNAPTNLNLRRMPAIRNQWYQESGHRSTHRPCLLNWTTASVLYPTSDIILRIPISIILSAATYRNWLICQRDQRRHSTRSAHKLWLATSKMTSWTVRKAASRWRVSRLLASTDSKCSTTMLRLRRQLRRARRSSNSTRSRNTTPLRVWTWRWLNQRRKHQKRLRRLRLQPVRRRPKKSQVMRVKKRF